MTSTRLDRVTKAKSKPKSKTKIASSHLLKYENQNAVDFAEPPELPLVERTNALPVNEFQSLYAPETTRKPQEPYTRANNGTRTDLPSKYRLELYSAASIPAEDFEACFALIEFTSSRDYDGSAAGWSASKKRKEMKLPDMRYLLLRNTPGANTDVDDCGRQSKTDDTLTLNKHIAGFLSFMVTYEDRKEVIYCYEIHLSPRAQGLGLGNMLMLTMEEIGKRIGLEKAMLTVFKSNVRAMDLYQRSLGYVVDEYSPPPRRLRNGTVKEADYLILSKRLDSDKRLHDQTNE